MIKQSNVMNRKRIYFLMVLYGGNLIKAILTLFGVDKIDYSYILCILQLNSYHLPD